MLIEGHRMDPVNPENPPVVAPAQDDRDIWPFLDTLKWGLFVVAAMFVGQVAVVAYFAWWHGATGSIADAISVTTGRSDAIALSVIAGLPAVLIAAWLAIRAVGTSFADYLGLRWTSWKNFLIGFVGLVVVVAGWALMSPAMGRGGSPEAMTDVVQMARAQGELWLMIIAFCVAAPVSEELFARGFLYRGWSESFLGPFGAIVLSSLVWTILHLQFDWYFSAEVFTLGLWFGYMRYRTGSTWLTIILHGLNNGGAVLQFLWFPGHS